MWDRINYLTAYLYTQEVVKQGTYQRMNEPDWNSFHVIFRWEILDEGSVDQYDT